MRSELTLPPWGFLLGQIWVYIEARQFASIAVSDVDSFVRYD
jgi:hypothetical protein